MEINVVLQSRKGEIENDRFKIRRLPRVNERYT